MDLCSIYKELTQYPCLLNKHDIAYDVVALSNIESRAIPFSLKLCRIGECRHCPSYTATVVDAPSTFIIRSTSSSSFGSMATTLEWVACLRIQCPYYIPRLRLNDTWNRASFISQRHNQIYSAEDVFSRLIRKHWIRELDCHLFNIFPRELIPIIADYDPFHYVDIRD